MFKLDDLLVIIPTIGRRDMLNNAVDSFVETTENSQLCVVFDDEEPVFWEHPRVSSIRTSERMGYWGALNVGLNIFPYPLLGYFANDVIFHSGWERVAVDAYNQYFPDKWGLLAIKDDIWHDYHAAHGLISKEWLRVLYGVPQFPTVYGHRYGDSELTQFSKDMKRFRYCGAAYVEHLHPDNNKREKDVVDGMGEDLQIVKDARSLCDFRYRMWSKKGRIEARKRMT